MADGKKKERTTVSIFGQDYTIVGDEEPSHVIEVAKRVDSMMREIRKHNPYLDMTKLAVLTAINVANDHIKLEKRLQELERKEQDRREETGPNG